MKRITAIILALIMALPLVSCNSSKNTGGGGVVSPTPKDGKPELTIVLNTIEYHTLTSEQHYFSDYIKKFENDYGVEIKFEKIMADPSGIITPEEQSEYIKKLSTKLITKDGPELIFAQYMSMEALIKQQAVVDVKGKIANLDNVYDSLLGEKVYYVPIGITSYTHKIGKDALNSLKIEAPGFDWTSKDYYAIRDKWISQNKVWFTGYENFMIFRQFIDLDSLYKAGEKKIVLNTPNIRQKITDARSYIFSGRYKLQTGYKYENYYNMTFEDKSPEFKDSQKYYEENGRANHIDTGIIANIFRAKDMDEKNRRFGTLMYPEFQDKEAIADSCGFLVNRNGKNLDLAYEFINGLLSDKIQMGMFENERDYYPVNKNIENDILKLEAEKVKDPKIIELKAYALQQLKDGKFNLWITSDNDFYKVLYVIEKDLAKFILADKPYSDEQLQVELKRLEDKYNILLNE